jgi:hypothetical protein
MQTDRLCLGEEATIIKQGPSPLLVPQLKPWTWVSTMFVLVCMKACHSIVCMLNCQFCRSAILVFIGLCRFVVAEMHVMLDS